MAKETIRVSAAETLMILAEDAANDLADLRHAPSYNAKGNHDSAHRRADIESASAIRAVGKAESILRMVAGLIAEGTTE